MRDPVAWVEAWRAAGAAGGDPVVLAVIEGLARRAAAQQGEARQRIVGRLQALVAQAGLSITPPPPSAPACAHDRPGLAALADLVERLGRHVAAPAASPVPARAGARRRGAGAITAPVAAPPVSLKAVTAFKGTWARLRAEQRLRQALSQVPAMAGPLNSSHVVHRGLQAMQALSPAYLDAFLAHVDALAWLEQAAGMGDAVQRAATPPGGGRTARGPAKHKD